MGAPQTWAPRSPSGGWLLLKNTLFIPLLSWVGPETQISFPYGELDITALLQTLNDITGERRQRLYPKFWWFHFYAVSWSGETSCVFVYVCKDTEQGGARNAKRRKYKAVIQRARNELFNPKHRRHKLRERKQTRLRQNSYRLIRHRRQNRQRTQERLNTRVTKAIWQGGSRGGV